MQDRFAATVGLFLLAATVGCSAPAHRAALGPSDYAVTTVVAEAHLIFNPEWTGLPSVDSMRSDWPSSVGHQAFGEDVWYEETIVDRQGRFGHSDHRDYYRRFTAVRTGRAGR